MLRPACLLPAARLAPPHGLLTPRSGTKVSLGCLESATRRSDAYRDGTLTRWTGAACSSTASPLRVQPSLCFVTHHARILPAHAIPRPVVACRPQACVPNDSMKQASIGDPSPRPLPGKHEPSEVAG